MAVDLRGRYREPFSNWDAATDAPTERLRGDLELLPEIAERGLSGAAKDISQAGAVGSAAMLAECSGVGVTLDVAAIPRPAGVPLERWLLTFSSYGYLVAAWPGNVARVIALFHRRGIAAADMKAAARSLSAVSDAIATILETYTATECANYVKNSGYAST